MTVRAALPDLKTLDAAARRALILTPHEEVLQHREQLESQNEELVRKDEQLASRERIIESHRAEIERLKMLILKLQRMPFGRKSEKLGRQIEQLELQLEELEAAQAETPAASAAPEVGARGESERTARRPLPPHLPREVEKILPKEAVCPDCGGALKPLGEDVSEMREWIPAQVKVIRQVRPKLACGRCDKIVQAEAPSGPIARGMAGTEASR